MAHEITNPDTFQGFLDSVVDVRKGQCRVEVFGRAIRVLSFNWKANATGTSLVEAIINFPIEGTLLHLRHQPTDTVLNSDYSIKLFDQSLRFHSDILGRKGELMDGGSGQVKQFDRALFFTSTLGTDGIATVEFGIPCSTPRFMLRIDNILTNENSITKLFWNPRP